MKGRPIRIRSKRKKISPTAQIAKENYPGKILHPDFTADDSTSSKALEESQSPSNHPIPPNAAQKEQKEIISPREFFSTHIGFEVEFFSTLENKPADNFMRELQGGGSHKVVIHTVPLQPQEQRLDWKSDDWTVSIARAAEGVSILGLSYGNKNTILALIQNASGLYKLYKVSGFAKSPRLIIKAKDLDVSDKTANAFGADRRNPLIEGRRRTGDRRLGSDRRREPALGRRSGKDRRKRSLVDRRSQW